MTSRDPNDNLLSSSNLHDPYWGYLQALQHLSQHENFKGTKTKNLYVNRDQKHT